MPITLALALYCFAWILMLKQLRAGNKAFGPLAKGILALSLIFHLIGAYMLMRTPEGYDLSFFKVSPLFFLVLNLILLLSSLKNPIHSLFILTIPLTATSLLCGLYASSSGSVRNDLAPGVVIHIALSIIAYGVFTMATAQALALSWQDWHLRHRHPGGIVRLLPPLQTMEKLFFQMLWGGEILLTLAIVSGAVFMRDIFAQHLAHKTVLSILAWLIYAVLLWGRHQAGWRGKVAIRWAVSGFIFLLLSYFGSKLVLEFILNRT